MSVRIMLVDDHRMFREALRGQLAAEPGFEIVAEAGSGEEALQVAAEAAPDVVILDIGLPGISGIDVARQLVRAYPDVGIVALSGYADRVFVEEMMKAGSRGYVVKSAGADELVAAVRAVAAGRRFLCSEITGAVLDDMRGVVPAPDGALSPRELDVLRRLAGGMRAAEIAADCGIATGTVEVHLRNIRRKLGLRTVADLTRYAVRAGMVGI